MLIDAETGRDLMLFIVDTTGQVERGSRTIVRLDGDRAFAAAVCRSVLDFTFQPTAGPPVRTAVFMPFTFFSPTGPPQWANIQEIGKAMDEAFPRMTLAEREQWIIARPSCSAVKE